MSEIKHECGLAAIYHLPSKSTSRLAPRGKQDETSRLLPTLLMAMQHRGQLAAGFTTYMEDRSQVIDTHREVGTVSEVFRLGHRAKFDSLMSEYAGPAGIGHVRYATCGKYDRSYAQPFERHSIWKSRWYSFAFNGHLANYAQLREEILREPQAHLVRDTDTEILHHLISLELSRDGAVNHVEMLKNFVKKLDGAWNFVFLDAMGNMFVARDPLGLRPLCYAVEGPMFAAASESVALTHLGFSDDNIRDVPPGSAVLIRAGKLHEAKFVESPQRSHCFFEWIYFASVGSKLDDRSVYMSRKRLGEELAAMETCPIDEETIVVPVPDTGKAAADSMAYALGVPSREGIIRNRYSGRTFIEGADRGSKVRRKYTPLREVLEGKRVLLVEDSIVRSTTMMGLISQLRAVGHVKEIHVRVACPPIVAPCFYGIDIPTVTELFAPRYMTGSDLTREAEARMAEAIGADSVRYLPIDAIARSVGIDRESLCLACVDTRYPTKAGQRLYQLALSQSDVGAVVRT